MQRPHAHRLFAYALISTLIGSLFSLVPAVPSFASHENITLNVGDEVTTIYDQGDTVVIVGTIDDVEEGEDVTIRILDPSGSEEEDDDVTPDEDDGYFDFVFDIPSNGDGGIWTVEASYGGEEAFSYFMVEYDDEDVIEIIVELDAADGIYEAGDEVTIEGRVEEVDSDEEFVEIIVLDPTNDEIVDEGEVELDDDEFAFEFDLDDDASHGRYAVIVNYDVDDQQGMAAFEIEDEDSEDESDAEGDSDSDGDLSAEILDAIYEPGDPVTVRGEIDGYDEGDDIDLEIVVQDPDGDEVDDYGDDRADVESNGDFEYEFDLEGDADEGTYTIIITYDNDEVAVEFEVEEGSGSGDSSEMTVELDKSTYMAGETIDVSGTVEDVADPDEGELVSIFIYRPTGGAVLAAGASRYVEPSSSGAYSATITIPSDLEEDNNYTVRVSYMDETVVANFDIEGVSSIPTEEITVETDEDEYEIGSTVEISGEVPEEMLVEGQQLLIRVNKPDGNPCRIDPINVPASGSFTYEMVLGGTCGVAGEYEVEVTYGDQEGNTIFELIGSSISEYNLNVDGDLYPIEYELSGGTINTMFVRPAEDKLVINIDAPEDGLLTVVLPREVIDSVEHGEDIEYLITIEDESGNIIVVDVEERENTDDARTLVIDYPEGSARIEIQGTQVVPEFGAIAGIIMAVAIVGMILATTRYNIFRQ